MASARRTWAALGRLVRPHRALAFGALVLLIAATAVGLLVSPLLGHMVDLVVDGRGAGSMTLPAISLAVVAVGVGVLNALGTSTGSRLGEVLLSRLREAFVERAVELPLGQLERAGSGDLSSRITNDVNKIGEALRYAVPEFTRSSLMIALTLVGLGVLDWRFMLAAAVAVPLQVWTARWYVRRSMPLYAKHRTIIGDQQHQLLNTIGGAATVRALRITDDHERQVERRSRANAELGITEILLQTRFFNRLNLAEVISLTSVLLTGFWLVRVDAVSVGAATAAALYFHALLGPITSVLFLFDEVQMATVSLARLVGVVELDTSAPRPVAKAAGTPAAVTVKAVTHSYEPGHLVLRDVDLELAAGSRTALVGASGAGKTTLAKLVAGVHEPTEGSISITGADEALRQVVLITQEVHVFAGPLSDDLRLARPGASDEELVAALTKVGAVDWALALPDGLSTNVGEDGLQLTAAQAQQVALARLILIDPPVAILDEATAEAGSAGARILEQAAGAALEGRTALVVAHRLTQAATADQIVVLDHGCVVESGTHDALVSAGGRYSELWSAWSGTRT
ncbi:ABC transporter ATP-binding protein [Kribbella catacumbae]|uniref:ABC transporter ATP-binding protein n=1 Tax=Kribbella catacumbae TaxID=460086 RepID=UPI001ED9C30A|nr:ABC transporter ATP-binding protein [Kribbella catacumbae]